MQESYEVGYEKEKQGRSVIRSKNQNSGVVNGNKFVAVIWLRQKSTGSGRITGTDRPVPDAAAAVWMLPAEPAVDIAEAVVVIPASSAVEAVVSLVVSVMARV